MRPAVVGAAVLLLAAAGMAVAAFATGGGDDAPPAQRAIATPAAPAAAADPGLAVWAANGCGGCHALALANAHGTIGPDLASTLKGTSARYIKEAIVAPAATSAAGYTPQLMPEDYAQRIPPEDLDALVAFIQRGVRR